MSIPVVEGIGPSQLVSQPDGTVTVSVFASQFPGATTYQSRPQDPQAPRPIADGDCLSIQPDGTVQGRNPWVITAPGAYEKALVDSGRLVFAPLGKTGRTFLIPVANAEPNV